MLLLTQEMTQDLSRQACQHPRLRANRNFHQSTGEAVHRFLNAMEPGTYVRPHRHVTPLKPEVFLCLTGQGLALTFDHQGRVQGRERLNPAQGRFGVEFPPGCWHTILPLVAGTVFYEVKPGPYDPATDKDFAPWAPVEDSPLAAAYAQQMAALAPEGL